MTLCILFLGLKLYASSLATHWKYLYNVVDHWLNEERCRNALGVYTGKDGVEGKDPGSFARLVSAFIEIVISYTDEELDSKASLTTEEI